MEKTDIISLVAFAVSALALIAKIAVKLVEAYRSDVKVTRNGKTVTISQHSTPEQRRALAELLK